MDFVESKFFYRIHGLEIKFEEREHILKMATKTEKISFFVYTHEKYHYVGKVPKIIFEKLTQKMINF